MRHYRVVIGRPTVPVHLEGERLRLKDRAARRAFAEWAAGDRGRGAAPQPATWEGMAVSGIVGLAVGLLVGVWILVGLGVL